MAGVCIGGDRPRRNGKRRGECQVCHASETFACARDAVYCGARLCANLQLCAARERRLRKRLCIQGTTTATCCLLSAADPTVRRDARPGPVGCMQRMRRVLLALMRRLLKGRLLARRSRGSLSDRPNLSAHWPRDGNALLLQWTSRGKVRKGNHMGVLA